MKWLMSLKESLTEFIYYLLITRRKANKTEKVSLLLISNDMGSRIRVEISERTERVIRSTEKDVVVQ